MRAMCIAVLVAMTSCRVWAFEYFEHRAIGLVAYDDAKKRYPTLSEALAKAERELGIPAASDSLTEQAARGIRQIDFGDLTALAGDFAGTSLDLLNATESWRSRTRSAIEGRSSMAAMQQAVARHLDGSCRWLYRTYGATGSASGAGSAESCFEKLARGHVTSRRIYDYGSKGYASTRHERAEFEQLDKYIALARKNFGHFPSMSWNSFAVHHTEAIRLARCFHKKEQCERNAEFAINLLAHALLEEAMAQHYLQDSFASGHIGAAIDADCNYGLLCFPPKAQTQHTHDVLNEIGLRVYLRQPLSFLSDVGISKIEWTAFGDGHYFIPEAEFHRWVVSSTAAQSIGEVLAAASGQSAHCGLCTTDTFPLPPAEQQSEFAKSIQSPKRLPLDQPRSIVEFAEYRYSGSRSKDERVPALPVEGWKLGIGSGALKISNNGRTANPENTNRGPLLRVDYVRSAGVGWPGVFGLDYVNLPRRGFTYGLSAGWMFPRFVSPIAFTGKVRWGMRVDETLDADGRAAGRTRATEVSIPLEVTYEIYRPFAVFLQWDAVSYDFNSKETSWMGRKGTRFALGLRLDFSAVQ